MSASPPRDAREPLAACLERASLAGMALGVALLLQPWWPGGLRVGFFVTLGFTLLQIVTSHVGRERA